MPYIWAGLCLFDCQSVAVAPLAPAAAAAAAFVAVAVAARVIVVVVGCCCSFRLLNLHCCCGMATTLAVGLFRPSVRPSVCHPCVCHVYTSLRRQQRDAKEVRRSTQCSSRQSVAPVKALLIRFCRSLVGSCQARWHQTATGLCRSQRCLAVLSEEGRQTLPAVWRQLSGEGGPRGSLQGARIGLDPRESCELM